MQNNRPRSDYQLYIERSKYNLGISAKVDSPPEINFQSFTKFISDNKNILNYKLDNLITVSKNIKPEDRPYHWVWYVFQTEAEKLQKSYFTRKYPLKSKLVAKKSISIRKTVNTNEIEREQFERIVKKSSNYNSIKKANAETSLTREKLKTDFSSIHKGNNKILLDVEQILTNNKKNNFNFQIHSYNLFLKKPDSQGNLIINFNFVYKLYVQTVFFLSYFYKLNVNYPDAFKGVEIIDLKSILLDEKVSDELKELYDSILTNIQSNLSQKPSLLEKKHTQTRGYRYLKLLIFKYFIFLPIKPKQFEYFKQNFDFA